MQGYWLSYRRKTRRWICLLEFLNSLLGAAAACRVATLKASGLQFAIQVAIIFAKVARVDFPRDWPTLFTDLLGQLRDVGTLLARRTFLVLHHILKELSSKRLASDQRSFAEVQPRMSHASS